MMQIQRQKLLNDIQVEEKLKYWVIGCTMNFVHLVDLHRISHLNCPKCERRTVKVLRRKSTGDLATLCHWSCSLCLCWQHLSCRCQHPPTPALPIASCPSYPSKYPPGPAPVCLPLAAHELQLRGTRQPAPAPGSSYRLVLTVMGVCLPIV